MVVAVVVEIEPVVVVSVVIAVVIAVVVIPSSAEQYCKFPKRAPVLLFNLFTGGIWKVQDFSSAQSLPPW